MNIAEVTQKLLESFSEALEKLTEWAADVLETVVDTLTSLEPDKKAPLTLDRPLMAARYPETFKYLRTKRVRGEKYV
jgi:3-dehydroquinate dehydratase